MARKMALVPKEWVESFKNSTKLSDDTHQNEKLSVETFDTTPYNKIDEIVGLFPKTLRTKAKLMLAHIKQLNLSPDNDVIYNSGVVGSNIYDLVKYFVSDVNFSPPRPIDSQEFEQLLTGVPKSAFGRGRPQKHTSWRTLY